MEAALGFRVDFWDYVTFGAIAVIVFAGLGLAVFVLGLPGRIAIARNHPEADAVNLMGWVGLGDAQELLLHVRTSGRDAVVPFWMEGIALYVECRDLLVGDLDALGIGVGIEFRRIVETIHTQNVAPHIRLIALSQVRPYLVAARSSHGDFGPRFAHRPCHLDACRPLSFCGVARA